METCKFRIYIRQVSLRLICGFLALCVAGSFSSCSRKATDEVPDASANREIILGFSQIGAESAWRNCNSASVREAATAAGIQLLFENAEQKQENQIKAIRSFIAYRVDVIAFVPIVADGWDNVLLEARNAGIPVLVTDRKINTADSTLFAGFIGTDSEEEGRSAGSFLVRKFADRKAGKKVQIVELYGTKGASVTVGRAKGFREAISVSPDFSISYSESGDFLRSRGYEIMYSVLEKKMTVDAVFSHNDSMTLGAMDAMRAFGKKPGKDIVIVTIDAEQSAIDALKAGEINCVVECNPKTGPAIMEMAKKLVAGEPTPWFVHVSEQVFAEDDVGLATIPPRGY